MPTNITNEIDEYLYFLTKRGLIINESEINKIKEILYKENYLNVIENYEEPFLASQTSKNFKNDVSFNSIYSLYNFDKNIKIIYFKFILKVEFQIKTVISNIFISSYGSKGYLKPENFNINSLDRKIDVVKMKQVIELIIKLESTLANKLDKNEKFTKSILKFGYMPFEIFINYLTLGEVSVFYKLMKEKDRNNVSKAFNLKSSDLEIFLKNIAISRNLCAHDEVFYNFKYKISIKTSSINNFNLLKIPFLNNNYSYGTKDTFSIAIALFMILNENDLKEFITSMEKEFFNLSKNISLEILKKIKYDMGFDEYWKNIIFIK